MWDLFPPIKHTLLRGCRRDEKRTPMEKWVLRPRFPSLFNLSGWISLSFRPKIMTSESQLLFPGQSMVETERKDGEDGRERRAIKNFPFSPLFALLSPRDSKRVS